MSTSGIVQPSAQTIAAAADHLRHGRLIGLPTETVYGLGADARSASAVQRVFAAKGRPANHPLIVHLGDSAMLADWADDVPDGAIRAARAFWPGPLTMILKRGRFAIDEVTGGQATIGIRMPAHPVARQVLEAFGGGIAAPSANPFGQISPTRAEHVALGLGEQVAMILDGGASEIGIESSIVDFTGQVPRILRPGMLNRERLAAILDCELAGHDATAPVVSGSLPSHYAPNTAAFLRTEQQLLEELAQENGRQTIGVIAYSQEPTARREGVEWRNLSSDPAAYAQRLYAELRFLDSLGLSAILIADPPSSASWDAIRDRLQRATQE